MDEFDYLDIQNVAIRKKAKKEMVKGLLWCLAGVITFCSTYSSGNIYLVSVLLVLWGFYRMFMASKYYVLGRNAVDFPKPKSQRNSSVVGGKIYKHKD